MTDPSNKGIAKLNIAADIRDKVDELNELTLKLYVLGLIANYHSIRLTDGLELWYVNIEDFGSRKKIEGENDC